MMKRKLEPSYSKAKDEKVNDEKATMKKVPLKADLIIQLKDLLDNFNNLEAINFKNLETIRDLQAKVEALEKEKCETSEREMSSLDGKVKWGSLTTISFCLK